MDDFLRAGAKHRGLQSAPAIGLGEVHVLTVSTGLNACATMPQIVLNWVNVIDHLAKAMRALQCLYLDKPTLSTTLKGPSHIPRILSSLPLSLCIRLPKEFLKSYGIMVLPLPANAAESMPQQVRYDIVNAGELAKSCTTRPSCMIEATMGTNAVDQHHTSPRPLMADVVY
ncbi:hypothetical protein B0H13DRAFT_2368966 [Mycena leptocephala]|nr:hypothetical protein B0H13DRAFT_2368966 [Mycena leptocephala]